jgi:quercetin 2,3-dioxygenase
LWINLPAKHKMSAPGYQGIDDAQIPRVSFADNAGSVRVIAGELMGAVGPAKSFTPINAWDLQLNANGSVDLLIPAGHTSLLIVQTGSATVSETQVESGELVLFERQKENDLISIRADSDARMLVLTGGHCRLPGW